jgi:hypothetical protein
MIKLYEIVGYHEVCDQIREELTKAGISILEPEDTQIEYPRGARGCWIFTREDNCWVAISAPNQGFPRKLGTSYIGVSQSRLAERKVDIKETLNELKQTIDAFEIRTVRTLKNFADLLNDPKSRPHARTQRFVIDGDGNYSPK